MLKLAGRQVNRIFHLSEVGWAWLGEPKLSLPRSARLDSIEFCFKAHASP